MRIWVDADACPGAVKEILFRAAERARVVVTLPLVRVAHDTRRAAVIAITAATDR